MVWCGVGVVWCRRHVQVSLHDVPLSTQLCEPYLDVCGATGDVRAGVQLCTTAHSVGVPVLGYFAVRCLRHVRPSVPRALLRDVAAVAGRDRGDGEMRHLATEMVKDAIAAVARSTTAPHVRGDTEYADRAWAFVRDAQAVRTVVQDVPCERHRCGDDLWACVCVVAWCRKRCGSSKPTPMRSRT